MKSSKQLSSFGARKSPFIPTFVDTDQSAIGLYQPAGALRASSVVFFPLVSPSSTSPPLFQILPYTTRSHTVLVPEEGGKGERERRRETGCVPGKQDGICKS